MINVVDVPVNTCPLDVLSKMGEEIRGSKLLFNLASFNKLTQSADLFEKIGESYFLSWDATEDFPQTSVIVEVEYLNDCNYTGYVYHAVYINATDICFCTQWDDCPNEYLFVLEE